MNSPAKYSILPNEIPLHERYISHLGEMEINILNGIMNHKPTSKNQILIPLGKPVRDIYYIKKGVARMFILDQKGKERNTFFAWDDMFITSYFYLFNGLSSDEAVIAVTDCDVYSIDYLKLKNSFDSYPKLERLGRLIAEETLYYTAEWARTFPLNAYERYMEFLNKVPAEIILSLPVQDIASFLGLAPASLSRIRKEFLVS